MTTPKIWHDNLARLQEFTRPSRRAIDPTTEDHHEAVGHPPRQSDGGTGQTRPLGPWDYEVDGKGAMNITCQKCGTDIPTYKDAVLHNCPPNTVQPQRGQ